MTPTIALLVFAAVGCLLFLAVSVGAVGVYNQLVKLKNRYINGFSQIEVQLKRRYDLIPNLVETVKAYLTHERATLEAVIAARNQASSGLSKLAGDPSNAAVAQSWMGAENSLMGALGRLSMVVEKYPDLKGNESVASLFEELTSTENKIAFARQAYNDNVTKYNTYRETFPNVLFASWFGQTSSVPVLEFSDQPQIHQAPQVALA